ncbi:MULTISPECIES: flagellin [Leptospira]|uniref:Flagellin n=2 Tax=Leptospira TaxID=171 RepID=A0A2N0AQ66_9LEPT|nr:MULTISPECIES: flagellin [Leptospira]PJZ86400.1 flagellin [Leptospira harrisiae]PKA09965.1 flagellin [Leptospira harrisiae]TGN03876.1 flagellin [Leptospira bandrabouensis]TGN12098.1 flagellin [Leptospira bandrabouensis]
MIINHNMSAIQSHRALKFTQWDVDKTMRNLSTGQRINLAGDDASGLAVSEKLRTQIRGLRQAERNTEDGLSFIQTAEGYLDQSAEIIQRIRTLAIQTSNGIYTPEDRQLVQVEVSALVDEIDRIASQAEFNKMKLFEGDFARKSTKASMWFHMGANAKQRERFYIGTMTSKALKMSEGANKIALSTPGKADEAIAKADFALNKIMKQRADMGAYQNRLESTAKGLMGAYENMQASESRIRDADMAEEMVALTTKQILVQSGTAMLAQASLRPNSVLRLLNNA